MKLDLKRLYKSIRKDKKYISNKYFGISFERAYPRTLSCHRGVARHFKQSLHRNVHTCNSYYRVNDLQHTIKDYHDVAVTMESNNFFRICDELQMESDFIEIR